MDKNKIIQIIQNEQLSNAELGELLWMLDSHHYKERPVTIQEFISSDDFVHKKWPNIFPLWQQTLSELFPTPFNAPYNEVLISAAAGSGKCLAKNTPILMYDGTIKMVQDVKVGDKLMGPDSKPRNVLSTCKGEEDMYEIQPKRGGENWTCNASHILSLKCSYSHNKRGGKYIKDNVFNIPVKEYINKSKNFKKIAKLYSATVDFPNPQSLEIDPYIYGLWIGDGTTLYPQLTSIDKPIIDAWCNYAKELDLNIRIYKPKHTRACQYNYTSSGTNHYRQNLFYDIIKESTISGHKRILHKYKTASRIDRWKLLAGIIDTDGYKKPNSNTWEITTKYKDLAEDYAFIARSLGCRVSVKKKQNCKLNGKIHDAWRVIIGGDLRECPIKLERKKANKEFRDGDPLKTSFKVIPKGKGDYYGFTIDSDHLFMLGDFSVTHNTVTSTISIMYDIYRLGCLKNPCTFYGLTPDTMIIMAIFSATGSTAAVNWNEITTAIQSCPWIMSKLVDKRGLEKKHGSIVPVEIIPGVYIQTGSKFQHSMGKAIFDGLMDEAAFGGANMKDAQKSYNELSSRIKTRFSNWGTKGNTPGHLFLISSPKEAGDFMQHRIEKAQESGSKLTKVMQNIATWEADPRKDSDDKFTVFIGNENKEPCIYEPDEDVPFEEMDYLIYPPMRYYEDFKKDLLISIMNYGGITTTSDMALFKGVTAINESCILKNPFKSDVIEVPFFKTDKSLMDFIDKSYFSSIRHPEASRFLHIDAAFSTNTTDVYGLASSYCILTDNTTINNSEDNELDIFDKKDRLYFTDFVIGITAPKGEEVPLYKVQDFIEWLAKIGYPIASVSADTFQSKQTLQNLQVKGFDTQSISVDRSRDPYLFLRQLVYNKQILMPRNEYFKQELRKLRDDGKKVDHPSSFHKDLSDAVAGSIWACANSSVVTSKEAIARQYFEEETQTYQPQKIQNVEIQEFERIKQNLGNILNEL